MATRIPFKNLLKTVVFVGLQIISYYIKRHSAGPSVNVDIFLAKVKIVRLQVFSYCIKRHSAGPSRIGTVSGE